MSSKLRSDFQTAVIKGIGLALLASFVMADTAAAVEAQQEPIKKLTQPFDPSPTRPGQEKSDTGTLVRKFAEIAAAAREDLDRVIEISATGALLRSDIGAATKELRAARPTPN